jgi:hypothetical protein
VFSVFDEMVQNARFCHLLTYQNQGDFKQQQRTATTRTTTDGTGSGRRAWFIKRCFLVLAV